jgi:ABC-type Fe3+ transport system substrate-binding protein
MLKLSTSVCAVIFLTAIFVIGTGAASYYYYGRPHPTHLRILHTHSDEMVDEVVGGFEQWYQQEYGQPIRVTAIRTDPQTAFEKATTIFRKAEAEIWWGGPLSLFQKAYSRLLPYNLTRKSDMNLTHPYPLMDLDGTTPRWYAASLYGLGVMYNEHLLDELNLSVPLAWTELTFYEYHGNIAMVDPAASESTSSLIMLMLQSKNWTSGWEYLVTLSTQIEEYDIDERDSALKVSSDYLPFAVVPDFYAYERMAIGIPEISFTYLNGTILQPDPIAILNRGTYIDEAKAFMDYILAPQAQSTIGTYLLPIHPDATPPFELSPFDPDFPPTYNYDGTLGEIIRDYYGAWVTRRHDEIGLAYSEISEADKTKDANSNATRYFDLAWSNFTYVGHYLNRTQIENLHNATDGWTENVTAYTGRFVDSAWVEGEWGILSKEAYMNALTNAQESKQAAENKEP